MRRDPAGPGSRGGNWRLDTVEDVRDYVAEHPQVYAGMRSSGDLVIVSFTYDLDEHLRGLQASVEHPELVRVERGEHPLAKLEADINAIYGRLGTDPRGPLLGGGPGHIRLRAPFAALAAELHRDYGPALEITLGHKPFPPEPGGDRRPVPLPSPTVAVPGLELTVTADSTHVVQGEDFRGQVVFANCGPERVTGMTGVLNGGVRAEGDDFMAGDFAGAVHRVGKSISLDPGASTELPLIVGTASCLPDASYVVPPGCYEVFAAIPFHQRDSPPTPPPVLVARGAWMTVEATESSPDEA
ncbi:MAG: hypothetical protein M3063_16605 [Actinomycetota bacterium]|nr:hypothetical protein [Actinomycetota bacterium]